MRIQTGMTGRGGEKMKRKTYVRRGAIILAVMMLVSLCGMLPTAALAEGAPDPAASPQEAAPLQDHLVSTKHTAVINGTELAYTAETGTVVLTTGGETCEIFYTAYTLDGVEDRTERPITFAFNGGPGVCSMYLHVGCLGPRCIELDENGYAVRMPTRIIDNNNSLLDITDLVFIDAVGTGYSRAAGSSGIDAFIGYENDNRTIGDFIRQYVSRNDRWESEKYLIGESYGTVRAVGVCEYLADAYGMYLNGLALISSANDYLTLDPDPGNELPYALLLPTCAADAWYHGRVGEAYRQMELEDYLDEVRAFVKTEYVPALFAGNELTESETDALAEKMAAYIGLSKEFISDRNLRISLEDFATELLRDQKLTVGRLDGRITGPSTGGSLGDGESDPSGAVSGIVFSSAVNDYIANELGFRTDREYITADLSIEHNWRYPIGGEGGYMNQEDTVYTCMSRNSFLKVWVLCGYYDGATPFHAAEWVYRHVFLNEDSKDRLSFTYYPSGHMIYMVQDAFDQFRADAENWYGLESR